MTTQTRSARTDECSIALLAGVARKDEAAMVELYECTRASLTSYIRRLVSDSWNAEEVVQDVYTYVWLHASNYHPDRGAPAAWLYMIARSRAMDSLRRSHRNGLVDVLDEQAPHYQTGDATSQPREIWWHAVVRRGVRELPAAQEHIIGLAFYEGYTHSEIAEATGLPLGTVKARIRMALTKLRDALQVKAMPLAA